MVVNVENALLTILLFCVCIQLDRIANLFTFFRLAFEFLAQTFFGTFIGFYHHLVLKLLLLGLKTIIDVRLTPDILLLGCCGPRNTRLLLKQNSLRSFYYGSSRSSVPFDAFLGLLWIFWRTKVTNLILFYHWKGLIGVWHVTCCWGTSSRALLFFELLGQFPIKVILYQLWRLVLLLLLDQSQNFLRTVLSVVFWWDLRQNAALLLFYEVLQQGRFCD